jgi:predicted kinase
MGTGKSVVARSIAPLLGAEIIRTDAVRKEILGIPQTERHYEDFGDGIYSDEVTRKTYAAALEQAYTILNEGASVIVDASFKDREERAQARDVAYHCDAAFFVVECVCPEDILKARLDNRMDDTHEVSDGRWEIFQAQKDTFDIINEIPEPSHIVVDTSQSIEMSTQYVIDGIRTRL